MQNSTDQLLSEIRHRNGSAIKVFVNRYTRLAHYIIRRHLGRKLRGRMESQDILNEFWVSMIRKADRLPRLQGSMQLRAFVRRVAMRQVTKQRRMHLDAKCRAPEVSAVAIDRIEVLADEAGNDLHIDEPHGREEFLLSLFERLKERERQVLKSRLDGKSNRTIAVELRIDEGSVRRDLRAIRRAAVALGGEKTLADSN
jgi:RNA polymerase sigma factor (sigma-70 family)